jgi:hypothetical protein
MRVVVSAVLLLLLTACSREAGPVAEAPAPDPGPGATQNKLRQMSADLCFQAPQEQRPADCAKYIVQLSGAVRAVQKNAGGDEQVLSAARAMETGIGVYRQGECHLADPADPAMCTQALTDISAAVTDAKAGFERLLGPVNG